MKNRIKSLFTFIAILLINLSFIKCQTTEEPSTTTLTTSSINSTSTSISSSTTSTSSTTNSDQSTSLPSNLCEALLNATCDECLKNEKCFYCLEDNTCKTYKVSGIFPEGCKASKARWISCSLNFEALLIAVISIGVCIILIIGCCVCYCCNKTCKSISDSSMRRVERKIARQRDYLKQKNEARRQDRQAKNEAIRVKYGLKPSTYSTLDD